MDAPVKGASGSFRDPTDKELCTVRDEFITILAMNDCSVPRPPPPTPKEICDQLHDLIPGSAEYLSVGRVKKMMKANEAETKGARAAAAVDEIPAIDPAGLPLWPAGKSLSEHVTRGASNIFDSNELLFNLGQGSSMPIEVNPGYDFKQSIALLGSHVGNRNCLCVVQDVKQTSGIVLVVNDVRVQTNGQPLFNVEWCHADRNTVNATSGKVLMHLMSLPAHKKGATQITASIGEQEIWLTMLRKHSRAGKCAHPGLQRSVVVVPPPGNLGSLNIDESMFGQKRGAKICAACDGVGTLTCSGCKGVHYCSKECQKLHWKSHKGDCRSPKGADGTSVVMPFSSPDGMGFSTIMNALPTGPAMSTFGPGSSSRNPHGDKQFVVKVQVPMMAGPGGSISIYDQPRSFQRLVATHEAAYKPMYDLVKSHGPMGLKAYLYARREGEQLRVYVDPAGIPQQSSHLGVW